MGGAFVSCNGGLAGSRIELSSTPHVGRSNLTSLIKSRAIVMYVPFPCFL